MNYSTTLKILPVLGLLLFSCQNKVKKDDNQDAVKTVLNEEELYRPNYHFTAITTYIFSIIQMAIPGVLCIGVTPPV